MGTALFRRWRCKRRRSGRAAVEDRGHGQRPDVGHARCRLDRRPAGQRRHRGKPRGRARAIGIGPLLGPGPVRPAARPQRHWSSRAWAAGQGRPCPALSRLRAYRRARGQHLGSAGQPAVGSSDTGRAAGSGLSTGAAGAARAVSAPKTAGVGGGAKGSIPGAASTAGGAATGRAACRSGCAPAPCGRSGSSARAGAPGAAGACSRPGSTAGGRNSVGGKAMASATAAAAASPRPLSRPRQNPLVRLDLRAKPVPPTLVANCPLTTSDRRGHV